MANFWEQFLPTAGAAGGYGYMMNQLNKQQGDIHDTIGNLIKQVPQNTQFQPWSLKSNMGQVSQGPNGTSIGLTGEALDRYNEMQRNAGTMMQRASVDPTKARDDYYGMMRGAQMPEEQRARQMLENRLASQGRAGIRSNAYGGSPEQLSMYKAMEENKNQAMLNADQMARANLGQQYEMGSGMFKHSYLPQEMLLEQGRFGMGGAELAQRGQLAGADQLNQLTLGQATSDTNYDNMMMQNIQGLLQMLSTGQGNPLSQLGRWMDPQGQGLPTGQQGPPAPGGGGGFNQIVDFIRGLF